MKTTLTIEISTTADVTAEQIRKTIDALINIGLADAQATLENGEGDMAAAELATSLNISAPTIASRETSVSMKHWDAYNEPGTKDTHQFDVTDERDNRGQLYATLGAKEGHLDDMISITMEVNTNPLNRIDHVPCVHVHFCDDAPAMSLFKIGDRILVRPETGVTIESHMQQHDGYSESFLWIEGKTEAC